jgi:hypothetical protein
MLGSKLMGTPGGEKAFLSRVGAGGAVTGLPTGGEGPPVTFTEVAEGSFTGVPIGTWPPTLSSSSVTLLLAGAAALGLGAGPGALAVGLAGVISGRFTAGVVGLGPAAGVSPVFPDDAAARHR